MLGNRRNSKKAADGPLAQVSAPARLSRETGTEVLEAVRERLAEGAGAVVIDLAPVEAIDTQGAACLELAAEAARAHGAELELRGARGKVAELLQLVRPSFEPRPAAKPERVGLFQSVGEGAFRFLAEVRDATVLMVDALFWSVLAPVRGLGVRWVAFLDELHEMAYRAIGIVVLLNFLLGVIIALLSAAQLRQFGAVIYVADLVVIAFTRELAVILTGIIVSARTGAAITAELATMKVQEELDALKSMGINHAKFLIAPKLWGLFWAMPALTVLGMIAGVAGGSFVGVGLLGESWPRWWAELIWAASARNILLGMSKSFLFAVIIALVGCHNGLRVRGGARGVGLATTRTVVMDVFFITVADMIFASIFFLTYEGI